MPSVVQGPAIPVDTLRSVLDSVFAQQEYQWARPSPLAFLAKWWRLVLDWLNGLEATRPWLYWFLFYAMLAVLAAIVLHAIIVFARTIRAAHRSDQSAALPAARVRGAAWYRSEALRLAGAGQFPEAMQHDFLGLVLELDEQKALRFHPSKTPGEYSLEVKLAPESRTAFRALVGSLYRVAFARVPIDADAFNQWHADARSERYAGAH